MDYLLYSFPLTGTHLDPKFGRANHILRKIPLEETIKEAHGPRGSPLVHGSSFPDDPDFLDILRRVETGTMGTESDGTDAAGRNLRFLRFGRSVPGRAEEKKYLSGFTTKPGKLF